MESQKITPAELRELYHLRRVSFRIGLGALTVVIACSLTSSQTLLGMDLLLIPLAVGGLFRAYRLHSSIELGCVNFALAQVESSWSADDSGADVFGRDSFYVLQFGPDSPFSSVCVTWKVFRSAKPGTTVTVAYSDIGRRVIGVNGEPASSYSEERPIQHHLINLRRWLRKLGSIIRGEGQ